jgi:DNA replication ATP-dependent helicase Dna2
MPSAKPSEKEEAAFMNDLFSSLDDSFWNAAPSPERPLKISSLDGYKPKDLTIVTPIKVNSLQSHKPFLQRLGTKELSGDNVNMTELLNGAEHWNWQDMESDFLTPKKKTSTRIVKRTEV